MRPLRPLPWIAALTTLTTALVVLLVSTNASADDAPPRAAYASVDELGGDGTPHETELALFGHVLHLADDARPSGLRDVTTFDVRERTLVGRTVAWAGGLDLAIGGSSTGFAYGGALYPLGLGARLGNNGMISLGGGIGADKVVGSVPLAARVPVELALTLSIGPLRPTLFVRPSWLFGADERKHGARASSRVDELEAGFTLRLGAQHRLWSQTNAGRGLLVGAVYRELMGARGVGVILGLDFAGGR